MQQSDDKARFLQVAFLLELFVMYDSNLFDHVIDVTSQHFELEMVHSVLNLGPHNAVHQFHFPEVLVLSYWIEQWDLLHQQLFCFRVVLNPLGHYLVEQSVDCFESRSVLRLRQQCL